MPGSCVRSDGYATVVAVAAPDVDRHRSVAADHVVEAVGEDTRKRFSGWAAQYESFPLPRT